MDATTKIGSGNTRAVRNAFALLAVASLSLLAIVAASLWLVDITVIRADEARVGQEITLQATGVLRLLEDAETGQRGYLLTGKPAYLAPYRRATDHLQTALTQFERLLGPTEHSTAAQRLPALAQAKMAELKETIDLAQAGRRDDALAIVRSDRGKQLMDDLRVTLDQLILRSHDRVFSRMAELIRAGHVLRWVIYGGGFLIVIFSVAAGFVVFRYTRGLIAARSEVEELNRDLEDRVEARTADLTRANDEIQRFAYIVSHDLRSPLVNVMGFTAELEEGATAIREYLSTPAEQRTAASERSAEKVAAEEMPEAIRFIRSSTSKMDGLINAILKLSREGGRILAPEPVDLDALIARQAAAIRHQLQENGDLVVQDKLPTIVSDRLALEQVFGNLIDNAVKYRHPDRRGRIVIRGANEGSRVAVDIEDNGRGVAPEDFERIFELFRRSGTQDLPGEGIGLAHVRALVRRLGGEIRMTSRLHEGSCFRVILPKTLTVSAERKAA